MAWFKSTILGSLKTNHIILVHTLLFFYFWEDLTESRPEINKSQVKTANF